jgi:hypothetical protein
MCPKGTRVGRRPVASAGLSAVPMQSAARKHGGGSPEETHSRMGTNCPLKCCPAMPARPQKGQGAVATVTPGARGYDRFASCPQDHRVDDPAHTSRFVLNLSQSHE